MQANGAGGGTSWVIEGRSFNGDTKQRRKGHILINHQYLFCCLAVSDGVDEEKTQTTNYMSCVCICRPMMNVSGCVYVCVCVYICLAIVGRKRENGCKDE